MRFRFRAFTVMMLCLGAAQAQAACDTRYSGANVFTACTFNPGQDRIEIFNLAADATPLGSFTALENELAAQGKKLVFAMNGGMFGEDLKPVGLYVEQGRQMKKLNRRNGSGNFHLKPNGVFYVQGKSAAVMESEAFAASGLVPDYATQSGPMLVINGAIHPKISPQGTSEKIRNGVGVRSDGSVVFVLSETLVTFHEFASFFRDELATPNALFLDGSVSSLYDSSQNRNTSLVPIGPMIAVVE